MKNILIVKFGALGDVIRTSYILPGLLRIYDKTRIYWLTSERSFDLLSFNPYVYELVTPSFNMEVIKNIEFDLVISLDEEIEILKLLDYIRYQEVIGAYLLNDKPTYSEKAAEWFDMGLISRYGKEKADELKKINVKEHNQIFASMLDLEIIRPIFFNSPLAEGKMANMFDRNYFNIGINSGAGSRWASKQLSLDETIKLITELLLIEVNEKKTRLYLLGGEEEEKRHSAIKKAIDSNRLLDTGNDNSLFEFAAIVKGCDYIISSDSLALHLAISQQIKNLSFYAPTSATEIGTFGTGVKVTSLGSDYCSYKKDSDNSTITAERILEAMMQHLNCD